MADVSGISVQVPHHDLVNLCKQAKRAGVQSPLCDAFVPEEQKASSWLWTLSKVVITASTLGAVGYGAYWLGAYKAAEIGGVKFEEFVQEMANMSTEKLQAFYQQVREMGVPVNSDASTTDTISSYLPLNALTNYIGYPQNITLGGNVAKMFKSWVQENTPGPNLNVTIPATEILQVGAQKLDGLYRAAQVAGYGVGFGGAAWGINKLTTSVEVVCKAIAYPFTRKYGVK